MIEYLQNYISEIFAGFAVILAAMANIRSVKSEQKVKIFEKAARRMEILVELERKNAIVGKLALVTAQKILLIQNNHDLVPSSDNEIERLKTNLEVLSEFKEKEDQDRAIFEESDGGTNIELHMQALTDIQRLRVRLEADFEKESSVYSQLLENVGRKSA